MSDKELNFEINILPILDILSVLICFLLLTAVWVQVGTLDARQAIADQQTSDAKNPPSIWLTVESGGNIKISLRDISKARKGIADDRVLGNSSGINWAALNTQLQFYRKQWPDLKTGIVLPSAETSYKDVIKIMDQLKQNNFEGVGLSPLS